MKNNISDGEYKQGKFWGLSAMAKSYRGVVQDVFSSRNILAIAVTTSMITLCDMGWRPFWSLYLKNELGASIAAVGLLSMIQSSERLLFQLPGGLIADRFGRRKIIICGTALRLVPPVLYLLATEWTHVIPALLVNGVTSIYMPAFNAIIADSLPETERGAGYGAYRMITSTPRIFSPVIGGVLMDSLGYREGVRIFLFFSILTNFIVTIVRWRVITETLVMESESRRQPIDEERKSFRSKVADSFDLPRTIWVMVVVAVLSSFATRMVTDFTSIFAVENVGLSNTQLGLVSTVGGVITSVLALPGGMLSDRFGRKPMIVTSRTVTPLSLFAITLSANFQQYFLVQSFSSFANALGGGGGSGRAGGPAWQALIADLVPTEKRATVMGTIGTVTGIVAAPSSMLGSFLWETLGPRSPFHVAAITGLFGVILFALGVKEPERKSIKY